MTTLELASNYYGTRAHYSADLEPLRAGGIEAGRFGNAVCAAGRPGWIVVYDQEHMDCTIGKRVSEMPLCKKCERAKARMEAVDA